SLCPVFVCNPAAPTEIHTLSLHDALPILVIVDAGHQAVGLGHHLEGQTGELRRVVVEGLAALGVDDGVHLRQCAARVEDVARDRDRKSTRLNSSHVKISYAVFCLKKKKK